jgi:tRNA-2-methylthio-N6-dimethylallyladenosine synthase
MNEHDSERILGILSGLGYSSTPIPEEADLVLLNTCSIREKADQKAYSDLGRLEKIKRTKPSLILGVAGCMAKQEGARIFDRVPHVNLIFNSKNIWRLPLLLEAAQKGQERIMALEDSLTSLPYEAQRKGRLKAWISIMEGCDKACTYCIVPYTRGREISRPSREILGEVQALAKANYKEVTLLGQNVNSYGKSLEEGIDFADLLALVNRVEGIERIRFTTSHPWDLSVKLIDALTSLPKVCEHLHLPLQSGSNQILNRMQREYSYEEYREKIQTLREAIPEISLTTDIIVGFPGEEEADFEKTLRAIQEIRYDGIFAFKYSHRPNTVAITMDGQISEVVKDLRLQKLLSLQRGITEECHRGYMNRVEEVLVEGPSKMNPERLTGRTRTNKVVNFQGDEDMVGRLMEVRITKVKAYSFEGTIAREQ